jgi:hypothetical protein
MADHSKIIAQIQKCTDPKKLKAWIHNAKIAEADEVAEAAFRKLISIVPEEAPGTVEHDFWQTINAFELTLSDERGKTTRLNRTRQKVERVGVCQTLTDWALSKKRTEGFEMLLERGMPEYTGEAIVLRHPINFKEDVRSAAKRRLQEAGLDPADFAA